MKIICYFLLLISFSSIVYSKDNLSYEAAVQRYTANLANTDGMKFITNSLIGDFTLAYAHQQRISLSSIEVSFIWIDTSQMSNIDLNLFPTFKDACNAAQINVLSIAHLNSSNNGVAFTLQVKNEPNDTPLIFQCKTREVSNRRISYTCISSDGRKKVDSSLFSYAGCSWEND